MSRPPIANDEELEEVLSAIELLLEAEPGTPEGDELQVLSQLVAEYEDIHYPLGQK